MSDLEKIGHSRKRRAKNWPQERFLVDTALADTAAIAAAICEGEPVMLVLAQPGGSAATLRFASGLDRPPPDVDAILELHRHAGDEVLLRDALADPCWAGFAYCGVPIRDASGALAGVLCVLRRPAEGEVLSAARIAAFAALGRRVSGRARAFRQSAKASPRDCARAGAPPAIALVPAPRILVVDDEPVVRMLVVDLLRERGHVVQEAEDAAGAMALLRTSERFDLMVTDIGLPDGFDGSTLARCARTLHPGLPILFITGYAFGANGDVTLEPGIPVLTKPFTLSALASRIGELLAGARA